MQVQRKTTKMLARTILFQSVYDDDRLWQDLQILC